MVGMEGGGCHLLGCETNCLAHVLCKSLKGVKVVTGGLHGHSWPSSSLQCHVLAAVENCWDNMVKLGCTEDICCVFAFSFDIPIE